MKFIKKLLAPKEVKAALSVLDEASYTFNNDGFQLVRKHVEQILITQSAKIANIIQEGTSPRQWVYTTVANIAGDLVESGDYHLYRGVLNPLGLGNSLLNLFDKAIDELTRIAVLDAKTAKEQKRGIRDNIKDVG